MKLRLGGPGSIFDVGKTIPITTKLVVVPKVDRTKDKSPESLSVVRIIFIQR
jgi:Cu/Ag efflux pump CusA